MRCSNLRVLVSSGEKLAQGWLCWCLVCCSSCAHVPAQDLPRVTAVHLCNILCHSGPSSSLVNQTENSNDCKLSLPLEPKNWDHSYLGADPLRYILHVSCTSLTRDLGHTDVAGTYISDFPILPDFQKVLHINLSSRAVGVFGFHLDSSLPGYFFISSDNYCLGGKTPTEKLQTFRFQKFSGLNCQVIMWSWIGNFIHYQFPVSFTFLYAANHSGFSYLLFHEILHRSLQKKKNRQLFLSITIVHF